MTNASVINSASLLASPDGFVLGVLRLPTYPWLDAIYNDLDGPGAVVVKACNGAGKTINGIAETYRRSAAAELAVSAAFTRMNLRLSLPRGDQRPL